MIRRAEMTDVNNLLSLSRAQFKEEEGENTRLGFSIDDMWEAMAKVITNNKHGTLYLYENNNGCIRGFLFGTYALGWQGNKRLTFWSELFWYVEPMYRRKGIGWSLFFETLKEILEIKGPDCVVNLSARWGYHEKLIERYKKLGFEPVEVAAFAKAGEIPWVES